MDLFADRICLPAVSKRLRGRLARTGWESQSCQSRPCTTLKVQYELIAEIATNPECDKESHLDGDLTADLVVATDTTWLGRGYHWGQFKWEGKTVAGMAESIEGEMAGISNAGTHHLASRPCESCSEQRHMEGQLVGTFVTGPRSGTPFHAAYLITHDGYGDEPPPECKAEGTIEGAVLEACS